MDFHKEKEDDLEVLFLVEEPFLLFFFDDPPPCDPANRCMLDVFDFFATFIMVMGYWLLVIEAWVNGLVMSSSSLTFRKNRNEKSFDKNTIFKSKTSYICPYYINIAMLEKKR